MFVNAIESALQFTRPVHSIMRTYGGKQIIPGSGTLFFVNEEACAITCKHVIEILVDSENKNKKFAQFCSERNNLPKDGKFKKSLQGLELKYNYQESDIVQMKNTFVDCIDRFDSFTCDVHPEYDLGIIRFNGYSQTRYKGVAKFLKDSNSIRQGKMLCRIGYPFPEFTNFKFNEATDDIEWSKEGHSNSPVFPIEGMVTRFLADNNGIAGIEMSTPGLRGQSGGPLIDDKGIVYGMQFSTKHLHLGFDMMDKEILINNKPKKVSDYSFLHLGQYVHVNVIKDFLRDKKIKFYEE
jgi:Trypsin-like peptidase domain